MTGLPCRVVAEINDLNEKKVKSQFKLKKKQVIVIDIFRYVFNENYNCTYKNIIIR